MSTTGPLRDGDRTNVYLAIIAYTLVAGVLLSEGDDTFWFAALPLFALVFLLPVAAVAELLASQ